LLDVVLNLDNKRFAEGGVKNHAISDVLCGEGKTA
jgi:hypothetical protein